MFWFILIIAFLIFISPDRGGAAANLIAFGIEVVITVALFGVNPILGIVAGYFFLKSWNKDI